MPMPRLSRIILGAALCLYLTSTHAAAQNDAGKNEFFAIAVIDDATGRGVPMVELRTTNELRFYTDSNGIVALNEPGLMDQDVYFHVKSHGYEYAKDGFGFRGKTLNVTRGGGAELRIKRINVAERLYRQTGEGIYRDSVLVGQPIPIEQPVLNGQVFGQDSVHATPYRGKLFWIWGDTNRPSYPLGNFGVSGANSEWPAPRGRGLDPSVGVNLNYFVNDTGFSRPMIPADAIPGPGPRWLGGLTTIRDDQGDERLIAKYVRMKDLGETLERGLVIYNDKTVSFERLVQFDLDAPLYLDGHPFRATVDGVEYLYGGYATPYAVRVRADMKHVTNPAAYEGFTCLVAGTRYDKTASRFDRRPNGSLNYAWKANTPPLNYDQQNELIKAGKMKREEAWLQLEDIDTGTAIKPHAGSVFWNNYRKRWVMIVEQSGGSSLLGEVWYAEADTPTGPWVYARKVVTHDKYTFYNPTQHPFFDQAGGRLIYFEGTYSDLFSGSPEKTPRYDYNQIMYRLSLDDPRLFLPTPVYRMGAAGGSNRYLLREAVDAEDLWGEIGEVAFFAVPPDRRREGLTPIYARHDNGHSWLEREPSSREGAAARPLFYALPPSSPPTDCSPSIVPLYEYRRGDQSGPRLYSTKPALPDKTLIRSAEPLCFVWRNPMSLPIVDRSRHSGP